MCGYEVKRDICNIFADNLDKIKIRYDKSIK